MMWLSAVARLVLVMQGTSRPRYPQRTRLAPKLGDGIKNLDTLSIYNEQGIEAAGKFDMKRNYTIELGIPIALVHNEINKTNTLSYQIMVNGIEALKNTNQHIGPEDIKGGSGDPVLTAKAVASHNAAVDKTNAIYTSSTDFSGEYTLIK
ncbi:hypothetical protein [Mucilaginibacter sp. HD30]